MRAQRSRSRNNNDNHQPRRPNHPGMRGPTPCASHPRTLHGLLSLPFIASIPHSAIPSPTRLGSQAAARPPPSSMGRFSPTRPKSAAGQDVLGLGNSGSGLSQRSHLPAPGLGRFPRTRLCLASVQSGACLCQYKSEFRSWLGHRLTHHRALSEFCFDLLGVHCLTCPILSKAPHPSLKINSGPHRFFFFFLKKCLCFH